MYQISLQEKTARASGTCAALGAFIMTEREKTLKMRALCAEAEEYCRKHGLPLISVDEIVTNNPLHQAWRDNFIKRWDEVQNALFEVAS